MAGTREKLWMVCSVGGTFGMVLLASCQSDSPSSPVSRPTLGKAAFSLYDAPSRTLGVNLSAGGRYTGTQYRTATATVTGGSGTYYYQWYQQACYASSQYGGEPPCGPQDLFGYGWGSSSEPFAVYIDEAWKRITVQVWDDEQIPFSGVSAQILIGPPPPSGGSPRFKCQLGDDDYPIHEWYQTPDSLAYSAYYRDGCTGARVYDSLHPKDTSWMHPPQ
jgi:hypothetical protein